MDVVETSVTLWAKASQAAYPAGNELFPACKCKMFLQETPLDKTEHTAGKLAMHKTKNHR